LSTNFGIGRSFCGSDPKSFRAVFVDEDVELGLFRFLIITEFVSALVVVDKKSTKALSFYAFCITLLSIVSAE
jgi:hypothetical protein